MPAPRRRSPASAPPPTYSPPRWARSSGSVSLTTRPEQLVHPLGLLERLVGLAAHHLELLARDLHQVVGLADAALHRARQLDRGPRHRDRPVDQLPEHGSRVVKQSGDAEELFTSLCIVGVCRTFRRLLGFLRPYRRQLIGSLALAWLAMGMTVLIPLLIGGAVNAIEDEHRDDILPLVLALLGAGVLQAAAHRRAAADRRQGLAGGRVRPAPGLLRAPAEARARLLRHASRPAS